MSVLLLSRDLATSSRVEGAAMRQHLALNTVGGVEQAVAACADRAVPLVIVDLTTASLNIPALVQQLKTSTTPPKIIAFGPHVHESLLTAAKDAACDAVMTRGQFFAQLDDVVARALSNA